MDYGQYLKSEYWQNIKKSIYGQSPKCAPCQSDNNLNIHHKYYRHKGKSILFKEMLYKGALIVLCEHCHTELHKYDDNWRDKITNKRLKQIKKLLLLRDKRTTAFRKYTDEQFKERVKFLKTVNICFLKAAPMPG